MPDYSLGNLGLLSFGCVRRSQEAYHLKYGGKRFECACGNYFAITREESNYGAIQEWHSCIECNRRLKILRDMEFTKIIYMRGGAEIQVIKNYELQTAAR